MALIHWRHLYPCSSGEVVDAAGRHSGCRQLHVGASSQRQPDRGVESDDDQHRDDEQRERVREENALHRRHPIGRNVTDERVGQRRAVSRVDDVVERASVHGKRDRRAARHQPDDDDHTDGSFQTVGGLGT